MELHQWRRESKGLFLPGVETVMRGKGKGSEEGRENEPTNQAETGESPQRRRELGARGLRRAGGARLAQGHPEVTLTLSHVRADQGAQGP